MSLSLKINILREQHCILRIPECMSFNCDSHNHSLFYQVRWLAGVRKRRHGCGRHIGSFVGRICWFGFTWYGIDSCADISFRSHFTYFQLLCTHMILSSKQVHIVSTYIGTETVFKQVPNIICLSYQYLSADGGKALLKNK